jgi:hypothetical protein
MSVENTPSDIMALTRVYKATVIERLKSNPGFEKVLYAEALESLLT